MSQQVNLLQRGVSPRVVGIGIASLMGVCLIAIVSYGWSVKSDVSRLRSDLEIGKVKLEQARNRLTEVRVNREKPGEAAALAKEIEALTPKAQAVSGLITEIHNGSLGSPDGYGAYFDILASTAPGEVWLTGVGIKKAGRQLELNGRAMRPEAVMPYVQRLNVAFKPMGAHFEQVEMSPDAAVRASSAPAGTTPVIFKLF